MKLPPVAAASLTLAFIQAFAATMEASEPPLTTAIVATGLAKPTFVTHAPGDFQRLFITEQTGKIRILKNGMLLATPFLDVSTQPGFTATGLEYGLLSLCFHPDYAQNGFFYLCYTSNQPSSGSAILARFQVSTGNPDLANVASATRIQVLTYTLVNHRSAWMDFGPDGYLYYNTGDGGEGDPQDAAQNLTVLRGKILRLDVNGPDGVPGTADDDGYPADANKLYHIPADNPFIAAPPALPEIWAYGLRNPWRASFDRLTGDLYISDVGQIQREEINFQPAGAGGRFYGWRCKEGTLTSSYTGCTGVLPPSTPPIFEYPRSGGPVISGTSVIGGYVYRGCAIPELGGTYFFGDWSGKVVTFRYTSAGGLTNLQNRTAAIGFSGLLSSFGEDAYGELYMCDSTGGTVRKIVPVTTQGPDCNGNARRDACDIVSGISQDANANEVPDECECATCPGDTNGDDRSDAADIQMFAEFFLAGGPVTSVTRCADMNSDDAINAADTTLFVERLLDTADSACP